MSKHTLYSPDGVKYETSSKVEATRLKAHGYTEKQAAAKPADKTAK